TSQANEIIAEAKRKGINIDSDVNEFDRVKDVFDRLKNVVHRRHLPWEIHVVENEAWNAFTIGGGKVFVFTGLLRGELGVKSDDELAAILAHEMAHVTARHASEKRGKLGIAKLADKKLRTSMYDAAFTTNQEDEADKFSVMYSALAGYDPSAAVSVWQRMHNATGSYSDSLLHDHPLNDDRASNLKHYAMSAQQYYEQGVINEYHDSLLNNNAVFAHRKSTGPEAGEGGGFLALLETAANAYIEVLEAKTEQHKRQNKQYEQERIASRQLLFRQLQIGNARGGGKGLFGFAVNATGREIKEAVISIKYWSGKSAVYEDKMRWSAMSPYEQRQFGIPLKPIRYTSVTISPKYVQFVQ
ncbi:MAG: M48 family metallopeptidase, partial [Methylococcales symbiont of Hymedesmia sp. n. MRB-2018]